MNILGIVGSLRVDSNSGKILKAAQKLCPAGMVIRAYDWKDVPIYNEDDEANIPDAVKRLKEAVASADGILFVTPEYNHSVPGGLKNLLDWASRPYGQSSWQGKPVALVSSSTGALGGVRAQMDLRRMFGYFEMKLVQKPEVIIGNVNGKFDADGNLTDEKTGEFIGQLLAALEKVVKG